MANASVLVDLSLTACFLEMNSCLFGPIQLAATGHPPWLRGNLQPHRFEVRDIRMLAPKRWVIQPVQGSAREQQLCKQLRRMMRKAKPTLTAPGGNATDTLNSREKETALL